VVDNPLLLQQIKEMHDINNKLYAQVKVQVLDLQQVKKYNDSLAKALKLKPKYIKGATIFVVKDSIVYRDTGRIVVINGDSVHKVSHHDQWVDIDAYAYPKGKFNLDRIEYKSRDSLWLIRTTRTPLFGRPIDNLLIRSSNPNNTIVQGASYQVREKVPWLTVIAGGGYNPFGNKVVVGVFAGVPIFSLKR
jgi:hypothetical protein